MKIPHIHNISLNSAVNFTLKSGKYILKSTKKCAEQVGDKGKKAVVAAVFMSGGFNSQIANKSASFAASEGDLFVHTAPGIITDCFGSKTKVSTVSKNVPKVPVIKSAKDVLLMDGAYKSAKELNDSLNNLLTKKISAANPLKNKAVVFLNKADKYGVNPVLLMAISMTESARGTSSAALNKNNVGGIMGKKGLRKFSNVESCIDVMAATVAKHHKERHLNTLYELAHSGKYCDKSVADQWIKHVMFYIKKLS